MPDEPDSWRHRAAEQFGVVSRGQLLSMGLSRSQARTNLANGRWRVVLPGVYATHTDAGPGAALSHATALWMDRVLDDRPTAIHLSIPARRQVMPAAGLRIHRARDLDKKVHPAASPARTRVEHSVLDHLDGAATEVVVDILMRSVQRRVTTADRLRAALDRRSRQSSRALIQDVLAEVEQGVQSPLERRYLRDVERAHGLPRGIRNDAEATACGTRYRDVRYRRWSTVVELDGRWAHPDDAAFRDLRRDNLLVVAGDAVLRYGWRDVAGRPCEVAVQVGDVLRARGWTGTMRPCGTACASCAA